jgi:hypothetical protein
VSTRVVSAESRLDVARSGAQARGIDPYRQPVAWLHLTDVTPARGTRVAVLWDEAAAHAALTDHPGDVIEIWPAADVAELDDRERVWRRS